MNKGHVRRRCPKPVEGKCATNRCGHHYEWRFSHQGKVYTGTAARAGEAGDAMRAKQGEALRGELLTKREQKAAEEAARQAAEQQVRLGTYLTGWIDSRPELRESTRFGYRNIVRLHVAPVLGDVPLPDLTRRHVRDLLEHLAQPDEKGKVRTAATLSRIRSLLSGALEDAVPDLIAVNPARGVRLPRSAAAGKSVMEVFSPAQLDRFLTEADKSVFGPCLRFIAATGVRRGEAVALRWDAVDLEQGTATISRNLTKIGGTFVHGKPKTKKGERKVPLDSETVTMLKDLRRAHAEETLRSGSRWNESGYVFTRADGSHLLPDSITQAAKRLTKALGLPNLAVHSLRHSYATAGLAVGMPTKIMSDILGHSTTRLTEDTYQHSTAEMMAGAAEMIAALRRGSNAASGAVQT